MTLAGNTFHRMARIDLLTALHHHCRDAGVTLEFNRRCDDVAELADADLIVAADGASSAIRTRYRERFGPTLDERPNLLAWYGTTRLFEPLSLIFRQHRDGLIIAPLLPVQPRRTAPSWSKLPPETFHNAGLDRMSEAESLAYCETAFAEDLQGHPLLSNRSTWFRYTIVKNRQLVTSTTSCCSATRCVPAIRRSAPAPDSRCRTPSRSSRPASGGAGDVPSHARGVPTHPPAGSDSLQQAAIKSTEWYETLGQKLHLDPISFAYDYLRRSGRVSHAEIQKRDPALAAAYERLHPAERS